MNDDEAVAATQAASERELVAAKTNLDNAVAEFTQAHTLGAEQQFQATQQLHTAVIHLWWKMRPHLREEGEVWHDLTGYDGVERDYLWEGPHPQMGEEISINGLAELIYWIGKTVEVSASSTGPLSSSDENAERRPVRLPAAAALQAAEILSDKFHEYGWAAQRDYGLPGEESFDATETDEERVDRRDKHELNL